MLRLDCVCRLCGCHWHRKAYGVASLADFLDTEAGANLHCIRCGAEVGDLEIAVEGQGWLG